MSSTVLQRHTINPITHAEQWSPWYMPWPDDPRRWVRSDNQHSKIETKEFLDTDWRIIDCPKGGPLRHAVIAEIIQ